MTHEGKRALVYGGSSGIGLATARLLRDRGASVIIASDSKVAEGEDAAEMTWLHCDVRQSEAVRLCTEEVAAHGLIDALVYSAGVQRYGAVHDTAPEVWDMVQAINVRGLYLAAHFAVPHMPSGSAIVAVSSVQGTACQQQVAAYAASKGAMDALTRAMAVDLAAVGIRVNAVLPGTTDTPMVRASAEKFSSGEATESVMQRWGLNHPLGRVARAGEVARVIAFLLSDEASFVTGSTYRVDGGLLAALPVRLDD